MSEFAELIAVDERRALEFFVVGFKDVCEADVGRKELLYNASILAHYAQVSTGANGDMPVLPDLGAVFDHFVVDVAFGHSESVLETVGAQCLLLTGFFGEQMQSRHNLRWYAELGAGFFHRAARRQPHSQKAGLLTVMAKNFGLWRNRHARLAQELRDQPYLINRSQPPRPSLD